MASHDYSYSIDQPPSSRSSGCEVHARDVDSSFDLASPQLLSLWIIQRKEMRNEALLSLLEKGIKTRTPINGSNSTLESSDISSDKSSHAQGRLESSPISLLL